MSLSASLAASTFAQEAVSIYHRVAGSRTFAPNSAILEEELWYLCTQIINYLQTQNDQCTFIVEFVSKMGIHVASWLFYVLFAEPKLNFSFSLFHASFYSLNSVDYHPSVWLVFVLSVVDDATKSVIANFLVSLQRRAQYHQIYYKIPEILVYQTTETDEKEIYDLTKPFLEDRNRYLERLTHHYAEAYKHDPSQPNHQTLYKVMKKRFGKQSVDQQLGKYGINVC